METEKNTDISKKISIIEKNIENLKKWLSEKPNNEDYIRLLKEYEEELKLYK
jgi:hypothetical protein